MMESKPGVIIKEIFSRRGIRGFLVQVEGREEKCISYPGMTGELVPGDRVLLNTTAESLRLGSGGYHYVIARIDSEGHRMEPGGGHIMKLRYTPLQIKVLSVEEEDSPYRRQMLETDSLGGIPVLVATLHSMLVPLCLQLREYGLKTAYVMTDGAALPLAFSRNVDWLKGQGLIAGSVTCGHAFGGDLEAVNVYSGLLAARAVWRPDIIVVAMGPGIVGTGTRWGFTGVEQGEILNAVETLHGVPVAVPRISFADSRQRHRGISHHTLTVLSRVCRVGAVVPLPKLEPEKMNFILEQLRVENLFDRLQICVEANHDIISLLKQSPIEISTMGRGVEQEEEFFLALGAAAQTARRLHRKEELRRVQVV